MPFQKEKDRLSRMHFRCVSGCAMLHAGYVDTWRGCFQEESRVIKVNTWNMLVLLSERFHWPIFTLVFAKKHQKSVTFLRSSSSVVPSISYSHHLVMRFRLLKTTGWTPTKWCTWEIRFAPRGPCWLSGSPGPTVHSGSQNSKICTKAMGPNWQMTWLLGSINSHHFHRGWSSTQFRRGFKHTHYIIISWYFIIRIPYIKGGARVYPQ